MNKRIIIANTYHKVNLSKIEHIAPSSGKLVRFFSPLGDLMKALTRAPYFGWLFLAMSLFLSFCDDRPIHMTLTGSGKYLTLRQLQHEDVRCTAPLDHGGNRV